MYSIDLDGIEVTLVECANLGLKDIGVMTFFGAPSACNAVVSKLRRRKLYHWTTGDIHIAPGSIVKKYQMPIGMTLIAIVGPDAMPAKLTPERNHAIGYIPKQTEASRDDIEQLKHKRLRDALTYGSRIPVHDNWIPALYRRMVLTNDITSVPHNYGTVSIKINLNDKRIADNLAQLRNNWDIYFPEEQTHADL